MRIAALALLAVGGCGGLVGGTDKGTVEPETCEGTEPTITVGTGQYGYEALEDGDPVVVVNGPQGGWHVWTSAIVTASSSTLTVHTTLEAPGFAQHSLAGSDDVPWVVDLSAPGVGSWDEGTCSGELYGQYTLVNDAVPPGGSYLDFICGLEGRELVLGGTITDGDVEAGDSVQVRAQLDPANVSYCHSQ